MMFNLKETIKLFAQNTYTFPGVTRLYLLPPTLSPGADEAPYLLRALLETKSEIIVVGEEIL